MKTSLHLHRVIVGRTREVRGPDALEHVAVAVCILVATVAAMIYGLHQVHMVQAIEAITLVSGPKEYNLIEYRAVRGDWPPRTDTRIVGGNRQGTYVKNITLGRSGVLTADLTFEEFVYHPGFLSMPSKSVKPVAISLFDLPSWGHRDTSPSCFSAVMLCRL